jgi:SAM-dependent methyltransferase
MSYQSFGSNKGASNSFEKLLALNLPDLKGKSFLDVGCNAGFFSGYAKFMGAARVLGIDSSQSFIDEAKKNYPECQFLCADWNAILEEKFDVILIASALHYSKDPLITLKMFMDKLEPNGVLVLEYGEIEEPGKQFIPVSRPAGDVVMHAQQQAVIDFAKVNEYFYQEIGPSVSQAGDNIKRKVVFLRKIERFGLIIHGNPTTGKSYLAKKLSLNGLEVIDLDSFLNSLTQKQGQLEPDHSNFVSEIDIFNLAKLYHSLETNSLMRDIFIELLFSEYSFSSNFILVGAVGEKCLAYLISVLSNLGIKVTNIEMRDYFPPVSPEERNKSALAYISTLTDK